MKSVFGSPKNIWGVSLVVPTEKYKYRVTAYIVSGVIEMSEVDQVKEEVNESIAMGLIVVRMGDSLSVECTVGLGCVDSSEKVEKLSRNMLELLLQTRLHELRLLAIAGGQIASAKNLLRYGQVISEAELEVEHGTEEEPRGYC